MELYRKNINMGGWFSFNSEKDAWSNHYADKMLRHFFDYSLINNSFSGVSITEELLITKNLDFSKVFGKKVLVIGGGPSSNKLTEQVLDSYDYIFTCNHFFRNSFLRNQKVHVVLVGDEVDLNDMQFNEYLKRFSPVIGFEHSSRRSTSQIVKFKRNYSKTFVFLTRYFSRLGYVPRACVIARCMGATQVDFIGLDGFKSKKNHYFEKNKMPPPFNNEAKFLEQMKIFCNYMLDDLKLVNFNNLSNDSQESIYAGILEEIKNEKN